MERIFHEFEDIVGNLIIFLSEFIENLELTNP